MFGRKSYPEPLTEQGALDAPDPDAACRQAQARFGEGWVELVLVPVGKVYWVVRPGTGGVEEGQVASRVD